MKLRFSHSVQNSERGKKIGNVMVTTSRNVVQTGKAVGQSVGGAFSSAKTAMSSWLSTFTTSTPQSLPEPPNGKSWGHQQKLLCSLRCNAPSSSVAPRVSSIYRSIPRDQDSKVFTWTVALCLNECCRMLNTWSHNHSRTRFPGWGLNWLLLLHSEPNQCTQWTF